MMAAAILLAAALASVADPPVTLHGIGVLRIGLPAAALRRLGATEEDSPLPGESCNYWRWPGHPRLGLMVVDGRLVRIDIADPAYRTLSGARIGLRQEEILALYGPAMRVEPHPYTDPEGTYLVYQAKSEPYGLIIETDRGRAQSMRVGYWENVQWIEGCS